MKCSLGFLFLNVLLLIVLLSTPSRSQIVVGADKLNFNSCAGYPNNCITPVDWTAVEELGLTHGIMHCTLHGYPGLPDAGDLPAGFSLYVLPLQMIEDADDLPSSVPCYHRNPEALGSFSSGLAYEYHPEFDQHFAVTDLDGNDCVGGEATAPGQFQYPGDEDPQDRYSWCVREGIHNRGIAISNPLRMWQEFSEGWSEVTHCSIRLRADVAGLPDTTVVFSFEYYEYDDVQLEWLQTDRVDFRAVQLDGHGTTFFELDIPVDLIGNPEIAIQIWWSGMGDLYFDRFLYFNDCAANVLSGASDNDMALIVDRMEAVPNSGNIEGFNVADEIGYESYHAAYYVENRIRAVEGYETQYWIWPGHIDPANPRYLRYALERTSAPYYNLNQHTNCGWCVTEDPPNTAEFQTNIQDEFIARMRLTQDANRDHAYGKNFHSTIGSYSLDIEGEPILRNRYPSPHEVLLDVNLSLCYGAKGIWYYLFRGGQTGIELYEGILDENGAITNQAVFNEITRINGRLTGPFGTLLSTLDWQGGLSRHLSGASLDAFGLSLGGSVTNARSTDHSVPSLDPVDETYVELGHFTGPTNDYLDVVNRRTVSDRMIDITFSNSVNITVEEAPTGDIRVLPTNGTCTLWYSPAEAKLLRISGNVWSDARSIDDTVMVLPNAALVIDNAVALCSQAYFVIQDGATVTVTGTGSIDFANGTIVCEGTGTIVMQNPNGLTGSGNLVNPNFDIEGEFVIPSGSTMLVTGGGNFDFIAGSPRMLIVLGSLLFECDSCTVTFDDIEETRVGQQGLLSYAGMITVEQSMHINVWEQGTLAVNGVDETHRCILRMKAGAEINTESMLDANYATFEGVPILPDGNEQWEGILVSGRDARISMNHALIKDIHCEWDMQGTGIHFFAASNAGNRIENTRIVRENQLDKLGDGIFLQPWQTDQSYVELQCVETLDDWWTGLTSVSSECNATGLTTMFNNRGVGAHLTGNVMYLYQSRLESNLVEGLYAETGGGFNMVTFGKYSYAPDGFNSVAGNGYVQIHLIGTYLNGGLSNLNDDNDIGHSSPAVLRMIVDSGAQAFVTRNYWLTPTPVPSMFQIISGSCNRIPYLTQSNLPEEMECFSLSKSGRHSILPPIDLSTMMEYGLNGRMSEVYAFVNARIAAVVNVQGRLQILRALLATEIGHAREYPDSMVTALNRVGSFLRQNAVGLTAAPAALVALRAEWYTWFGMPDSADVEYRTLATSYPNSSEYRATLPSKLINAFNNQDSLDIEDAIAEMSAAGCESSALRIARSERRAYYRCRRSSIIPKRAERNAGSVVIPDAIQLLASPNPARGEVTITCILPEPAHVQITLYAIDGKELRTLYSEEKGEGAFTIHDTVQDLIPGTYLYRAVTRYHSGSTRILVVR